jgi:hypothetical protein
VLWHLEDVLLFVNELRILDGDPQVCSTEPG